METSVQAFSNTRRRWAHMNRDKHEESAGTLSQRPEIMDILLLHDAQLITRPNQALAPLPTLLSFLALPLSGCHRLRKSCTRGENKTTSSGATRSPDIDRSLPCIVDLATAVHERRDRGLDSVRRQHPTAFPAVLNCLRAQWRRGGGGGGGGEPTRNKEDDGRQQTDSLSELQQLAVSLVNPGATVHSPCLPGSRQCYRQTQS